MADYNILSDLLDTFQSSSDYIKTLIILTPPAFTLATLTLLLRYRRPEPQSQDEVEEPRYQIEDRRTEPLTLPMRVDRWDREL